LANVLYSRRNFPYFSVCAVAGLDDKGNGALYRYDALGSFERVRAVCAGKGERLIQPILDEITGMEEDEALFVFPGSLLPDSTATTFTTTVDSGTSGNIRGKELDVEEACDVIVTAFKAAAEREISIGDGIDVCIIRGEVGQEPDHGLETMSLADDHLMDETMVARSVDQRIDGTKTVVQRRTPRVVIERRSFSLPRH
jgi:20S proteasome subunit beta 6